MPLPADPDLDLDLRYAAARGQFVASFEPVVALATDAVAGFVVRPTWHHPARGVLGPEVVRPVAERTDLADDLDRWLVQAACDAVTGWGAEALDALGLLVVPCAASTAQDPDVPFFARAVADMAGLPPDRLVLNWPQAALSPALAAAHTALGLGLASDDLPPAVSLDVLVLDESARAARVPTEQTVRQAARRGVRVLAEGVGPDDTADTLQDWGVTYASGGLPPGTAADARAALTRRTAQPAR